MTNDGTQLENLVADVERRLMPGFDVELHRKFYNDDGVQIAEFDIVITGDLGSSKIHWLIECRDREDAAPVSWIEQLVGRRQRFGIDRVFAVSTSGFSPGAIEFAAREHIILRTVDDITLIPDAFVVRDITDLTDDDIAVGLSVSFINIADDERYSVPLDDLKIFHHGVPTDAGDFFMGDLEKTEIFLERSPTIATVELPTYVHTAVLDATYNGLSLKLRSLTAPLHVTKQSFPGKLLLAQQYSEDSRIIGQVGEYEFETRDGRQLATIQVTFDSDGKQHVAAILPDGSPLSRSFTIS